MATTHYFHYQNNQLFVENIEIAAIAAQFGTPTYIYSQCALLSNWQEFDQSLQGTPHRICYAVKANSNLAILNILAKQGCGFDIVSLGELERVLAAGGDPNKIVFSGVGKTTVEIERAIAVGISCFNVESESELERLQIIAKQYNKIIPIALRINPNIDAKTHPYIATGLHENKFGIEIEKAWPLCQKILTTLPNLKLIGIACHIGSQLMELQPIIEAIDCLDPLIQKLLKENISLQHINIGGGLGVQYQNETPPSIQEYTQTIRKKLEKYKLEIILEPGRTIVANTGILLTKIEYIKQTAHKNFAIVDAAMNDLMRPALYDAWQPIFSVFKKPHVKENTYDVVGPVCESADFLGKNRLLAIEVNDLLAIGIAGAYGASMSSNYNSRPRAAEVLVDGDKMHLIRRREEIPDLFRLESITN